MPYLVIVKKANELCLNLHENLFAQKMNLGKKCDQLKHVQHFIIIKSNLA